jgi:hypothetical protein
MFNADELEIIGRSLVVSINEYYGVEDVSKELAVLKKVGNLIDDLDILKMLEERGIK